MTYSVTVKAPSSTANLGPGFDVFGLAVNAFYDTITLTKKERRGITIISDDDVPVEVSKNTAGLVVQNIAERFKIKSGLEIKIRKGVPPGFGMGSSAASAAAAAVAMKELFGLKIDENMLVEFAGTGERASAGSIHYDNVAASVLKKIKLSDSILNLSNASAIVAGFMTRDTSLIGKSVVDVIVEPARKHMIPGFDQVKKNALKAGAIGVTISGAGPSVIAFASTKSDMRKISKAMSRGFSSAKIESQTIVCKPSKGATSMKK